MQASKQILGLISIIGLTSCAPVKNNIQQVYQLENYSTKHFNPTSHTLTVSHTSSINGYRTEQMLYIQKPYTIMPFAQNVWQSPPADMLFSLLTQSLQQSGYFKAVAAGPYAEPSEYRLDTTLISMQQNFLKQPSVYEIRIQAVLNQVSKNQVIASKTFTQIVPCPSNNPYGGVIAANKASGALTHEITQFVIHHIANS